MGSQSGQTSPSDTGAGAFDRFATALQFWYNNTARQVENNLTFPLTVVPNVTTSDLPMEEIMWEYQVCTEFGAPGRSQVHA
jgi:hypothetical protein